jgi:hypothetical protein
MATKKEDRERVQALIPPFLKAYAISKLLKKHTVNESYHPRHQSTSERKKNNRLLSEEGVIRTSGRGEVWGNGTYFEEHYKSLVTSFNIQEHLDTYIKTVYKSYQRSSDTFNAAYLETLQYITVNDLPLGQVLWIYDHRDDFIFKDLKPQGHHYYGDGQIIGAVPKNSEHLLVARTLRQILIHDYQENFVQRICEAFDIKRCILDDTSSGSLWVSSIDFSTASQGLIGIQRTISDVSRNARTILKYQSMLKQIASSLKGYTLEEAFKIVVCSMLNRILRDTPKLMVLTKGDDSEPTNEAVIARYVLENAKAFTWDNLFEGLDLTPYLKVISTHSYEEKKEEEEV